MKLSELKTGEKGIIVKVLGHGGFRKRIIEMGFIKGQEVEVLLNAPLQDPVKYKLMGYEVSLRHQEADHIEVVSGNSWSEEGGMRSENTPVADSRLQGNLTPHSTLHTPLHPEDHPDDYLQHIAKRERRTINVALVGNPNCGKTSLFNYASGAHGHVGNYSGVTVDATEAHASMFGYDFNLTDLPGTYSLSCYSPEELYVSPAGGYRQLAGDAGKAAGQVIQEGRFLARFQPMRELAGPLDPPADRHRELQLDV